MVVTRLSELPPNLCRLNWSSLLLAGAESVLELTLTRVAHRQGHLTTPNYSLNQSRTVRIRQSNSLDFSNVVSTSPSRFHLNAD